MEKATSSLKNLARSVRTMATQVMKARKERQEAKAQDILKRAREEVDVDIPDNKKTKTNADVVESTSELVAEASTSATEVESAVKEYPVTQRVKYLTTEAAVNDALAMVREGPIGFDSEFLTHKPSALEEFLDDLFLNVAGSKKSVLTALRALELQSGEELVIDWDEVGLCVIQLAKGDDVWLVNMNRVRAYPSELRRILMDPSIVKAGVGMGSDIAVLWRDIGADVNNFVDCGLMTRLTFTEQYMETGYTWLAMKTAIQDVLGLKVSKDLQKSNWKGDENGDLSEDQQKYAAIDAHASLKLYERLVPALASKSQRIGIPIPQDWYTFNGRYGEAVRLDKTCWDRYTAWSLNLCSWFFLGKFQGYHYPYPVDAEPNS